MKILDKYNSNVVLDIRPEGGGVRDFSASNLRVTRTSGTTDVVQNGLYSRNGFLSLNSATPVRIAEKTIIAIFSIEEPQTATVPIFSIGSSNYYLGTTNNDELILSYQIAAGTQATETTSNSPLKTDGKDNISITSMDVDGSNVRVFHHINGCFCLDSTRATGAGTNFGSTGYIMSYNGSSSFYYGTLKRLVILDTALNDEEAEQLYTELKKRTLNKNNVERLKVDGENTLLYSETFENANWNKANISISDNSIISPFGDMTGSIFSEDDTAGVSHYISVNPFNTEEKLWYTVSVYAKAINRNWFALYHACAGADPRAYFNLNTGETSDLNGPSSEVYAGMEYISDGWYRCWVSWLSYQESASSYVMALSDAAGSLTFDGLDQESIAFFGMQAEQRKGSPSKYKKTYTIAREKGIESDYYVGEGEGWNVQIDLATGGVDDGPLKNTGWIGFTGEENFVYSEIQNGKEYKYLYGDGVYEKAYKPSFSAYGTWIIKINPTISNPRFAFISTGENPTDASTGSYYIQWDISGKFDIWRNNGAGSISQIFVSESGLFSEDEIHTLRITRDKNGVFTFYIKGNDPTDEYIKVPPAMGSTNPLTDTSVTTSNFMVSQNSGMTEIISNHVGGFNCKPYEVL